MASLDMEKCYAHDGYRDQSDSSTESSAANSPVDPISMEKQFQVEGHQVDANIPLSRQQSRTLPKLTRLNTGATTASTMTSDPAYEVDWEDDDPENPRNWPMWYKCMTMFFLSISTIVVVLYSTSYTSAIPAMMDDLGVSSKATATLGLTTYLIGLAVGSVILAPISETYGRKPVYVTTMFIFTILIIPCGLANDITTIIVVRFFSALMGSSMISNAPGTIGDLISEDNRAIAFSLWSIGPMNGPVIGPVCGAFITQYLSWRWANWIVMMLAGVSFVMMASVKETYAPVLLQRRAKKLRKERGENRYWSQYDVRVGFLELMRVNLSRPFVMALKEPICIFWNAYIGIIYAELYLSFASYPIIFKEIRAWSLAISSLSFCGIGVGIMITICLASPIKKMINSHKVGPDGTRPPESMMSVVCIAAVLVPIGQLWFAWTCVPVTIHPAISIAAGIPFGAGNAAIFIYASNYLVGSYGIYAASALAGNAVIRSILGGVLPLAAGPLFAKMGPNWAGTFLGLLEVIIIPVPFIFYRYGHKIREKSSLIREMRDIELKQEEKKTRAAAKRANQTGVMMINGTNGIEVNKKVSNASELTMVAGEKDVEKVAEAELSRVQGLMIAENPKKKEEV